VIPSWRALLPGAEVWGQLQLRVLNGLGSAPVGAAGMIAVPKTIAALTIVRAIIRVCERMTAAA